MSRRFHLYDHEATRRWLVSQAALRRSAEKEMDDMDALVYWAKDAFDNSDKSILVRNRFTTLYDSYQLQMNRFSFDLSAFISDPSRSYLEKHAIMHDVIQKLRNLANRIVRIAEVQLIPTRIG
ncbi:hypothetical protein HA402_013648 [Bradysia odoriphaga]|nr:hypothetical protein HA402_013648 [Bradysia odoriphaga]